MSKHEEHGFSGKPRPKSQNVAQPVLKLKRGVEVGRAWWLGLGLCDLRQDKVLLGSLSLLL